MRVRVHVATYVIEDNTLGDPVVVNDVSVDCVCHGAQDYLKEVAFPAELLEAGK